MNRIAQDVFNYFMHFILLYVACCVVLGSVLSLVALIVGGILYFGFGADFIADSSSSLGGVGIGLSVAFLGSFVVAIVGTIMMAPTEKNRRRDYAQYSRGVLSSFGRPEGKPNHDIADDRGDLRSAQ